MPGRFPRLRVAVDRSNDPIGEDLWGVVVPIEAHENLVRIAVVEDDLKQRRLPPVVADETRSKIELR